VRLVLISDTHLTHLRGPIEIPDGDMLIHAGDVASLGKYKEIVRFSEWFSDLPHKHKVMIAGNHDWDFQTNPDLAKSALDPSITYLQDSEVTIEGIRIYGTPWQPAFQYWAFNLPRGIELDKKWDQIPSGIDILVTHGPPFGICDSIFAGGEHLGCRNLLRQVTKRVKPRIHTFGHIHGLQ
jgi:Icc-related predicted phosphoesterase